MGRLVLFAALLMVVAGLLSILFRKRTPKPPVDPPARLDDYRRKNEQRKSEKDDVDDDLF